MCNYMHKMFFCDNNYAGADGCGCDSWKCHGLDDA